MKKYNAMLMLLLCCTIYHNSYVMNVATGVELALLSFLNPPIPTDLHTNIWEHCSSESVADTTTTIRALSLITKNNQALLNDPNFLKKITKNLSKKLCCSDEAILTNLPTNKSKKIMLKQNKLFGLCYRYVCGSIEEVHQLYQSDEELFEKPIDQQFSANIIFRGENREYLDLCLTKDELQNVIEKEANLKQTVQLYVLQQLYNEGVDLEFTYSNHKSYITSHVTPFMILCSNSLRLENEAGIYEMMQFFIDRHREKKIDLSKPNGQGITPLMFACAADRPWAIKYLCKKATADITLICNINQQDAQGNTALMHYFNNNGHSDVPDKKIIQQFIEFGADLEIGNYAGLMPMEQLKASLESTVTSGCVLYDYYEKIIIEHKKFQSTHAPQ